VTISFSRRTLLYGVSDACGSRVHIDTYLRMKEIAQWYHQMQTGRHSWDDVTGRHVNSWCPAAICIISLL